MSTPEHRGTSGAVWRGCGLLVLAALVWAQLALATHQLDHPATSADDACSICLQLDRSGDGVATALPAAAESDAVDACPAAPLRRTAARDGLPVRQRGPPLS